MAREACTRPRLRLEVAPILAFGPLGIAHPRSPAPCCYDGPDGLDHAERPSTLQEAIHRPESARACEGQNEPRAPVFQGVEYQHCRDSKKAEKRERIHTVRKYARARGVKRSKIQTETLVLSENHIRTY